MLTVSFQSVLEGVFKRAGIDPEDASSADQTAVIEAIADRYKTAHEFYRWPIFTDLEQRFFRQVWNDTDTYAEDDEIYFEDDDTYYTANQAVSAGQSPDTNPEKWDELTDFHRYVDYEQPGETAIEAVLGAWDEDPRVTKSAVALTYKIRKQGISFAPDVGVTSVFLEYRERATDFAAEIYDEAEEYEADRIVYFPEIGDVYKCATATTAGQTPGTHPAKWVLQEFPDFLARAVKAGAYCDWLTGDERPQAAELWEGKFTDLLEEQVWQITKLQGQTGRPQVHPAR